MVACYWLLVAGYRFLCCFINLLLISDYLPFASRSLYAPLRLFDARWSLRDLLGALAKALALCQQHGSSVDSHVFGRNDPLHLNAWLWLGHRGRQGKRTARHGKCVVARCHHFAAHLHFGIAGNDRYLPLVWARTRDAPPGAYASCIP